MIIQTGYMQPTAAQRRMIREHGNGDFTGQLPPDFGPVPMFDGWTPDLESMVPIKLRCVGPHKDGWVGSNPAPRRYLSVFWLTKAPIGTDFRLHVRNEQIRMTADQWVLFNDGLMHSVFAERLWHGVAYQMRPTGDNA